MRNLVYLDNNATTKVDERVSAVMQCWQSEWYGNPSSLHEAGKKAATLLADSRKDIASVLGVDADEIIFTASGSEGNNLCIKGYCDANSGKGNHIITSSIEHPSVTKTVQNLEKRGFSVTYLDVDMEGFVSIQDLEAAMRPETILVSIMHANNEIGTIQNIAALSEVADRHRVAFHTDTVQSFLKVPVLPRQLGVSLATFSGHKIHAPKGIGFIYKKKDISITRQIDGGGQETNLRAGTENIPSIAGLREAIMLFSEHDLEQIRNLQEYLISKLLQNKMVRLNGPRDLFHRLCNNINISIAHVEGEALLDSLSARGICVSTGSACSSKSTKISPVLKAINCPMEYIHGNLRISTSRYTSLEELNIFLRELKDILEKTSGILKENI